MLTCIVSFVAPDCARTLACLHVWSVTTERVPCSPPSAGMLERPYAGTTRLGCFSGPGDCELSQAISCDGALVPAQTCSVGATLLATGSFLNRPGTCGWVGPVYRLKAGSCTPPPTPTPTHPALYDPIFTSLESTC